METKFAITETIYADDIKRIRNRLGLTQADFAKLVNCSKRAVENWEMKDEPIKGPIVTIVKILQMYPELRDQLCIPEQIYPLRMYYMYHNEICTVIDIDERRRKVEVYNYRDDFIYRAFGKKELVTYEEYEKFLESRCFPKERDKMKIILKEMDLPFYDPMLIIEKTEGRMAEDDFWIRMERKSK